MDPPHLINSFSVDGHVVVSTFKLLLTMKK